MGGEGIEPSAGHPTIVLATVLQTAVGNASRSIEWRGRESNPQAPGFEPGRFAGLRTAPALIAPAERDHGDSNPDLRADNAACSPCTMIPSPRGRSGGRNRTCGLLVQSQALIPASATPERVSRRRFGERDSNPHRRLQRPGAYHWPIPEHCRSSFESAPRGSNPLLPPGRRTSSRPTRGACMIAVQTACGAEGAGVEPARLIARPLSRRVPSPVGLPFRSSSGAPAGGVEPPTARLTIGCPTIGRRR